MSELAKWDHAKWTRQRLGECRNRVAELERELERLRVPGILPFLCPICGRKRMEYRKEGLALFVECTKCGADHETICDVALDEQPEERR